MVLSGAIVFTTRDIPNHEMKDIDDGDAEYSLGDDSDHQAADGSGDCMNVDRDSAEKTAINDGVDAESFDFDIFASRKCSEL